MNLRLLCKEAPLIFPPLISNIDFPLLLVEHPSWRCIFSSFVHLIGPKKKKKNLLVNLKIIFGSTLNLFIKKYMAFYAS